MKIENKLQYYETLQDTITVFCFILHQADVKGLRFNLLILLYVT